MNSRHRTRRGYRVVGWLATVALATPVLTAASRLPAAGLPPWTLRLAIHYLPPATNRSQYGVVLAWPGQA
ncbi:MAG TPA: hypothetical protein VFW16_08065 [Streptosporangiaceae bacterium]|nr:hypothetical protein [Streptosporangiaceae bacterium]